MSAGSCCTNKPAGGRLRYPVCRPSDTTRTGSGGGGRAFVDFARSMPPRVRCAMWQPTCCRGTRPVVNHLRQTDVRQTGRRARRRPRRQSCGRRSLTPVCSRSPLPESAGGDDLGVLGVAPLLRALGAAAAVTPAIGAIAAELTLRSADPDTRARLAAPLVSGSWYSVAVSRGRATHSARGPLRISSTASSPA